MDDGVFWSEDEGHRIVTARCVSSPTSPLDGVKVKVPTFDEGLDEFGPCAFLPIPVEGGALYPVDGDTCLLAFDERNVPWVVAWTPLELGAGSELVERVQTLEDGAASTSGALSALDGRVDALEAIAAITSAGLTGSWAALGGAYGAPGYYSDRGRTYLTGAVKSGTSGTSAFTLPAGLRPLAMTEYPIVASGGSAEVVIATDGTVKPTNIGASSVAVAAILEGVNFRHV